MNQQIFKEILSLKRQILPNGKVILFGSQARGDVHEDSDWDDGYQAHTHSGVKTLIGLHYVNNNLIDKSLGKMYRQVFNLHQTGDYEDWINFDQNDLEPFFEPAAKFIAEIENIIEKNMA